MNGVEVTDDPALPRPVAEVAVVLDVDADGVRVRDTVQLFLARLVDPALATARTQRARAADARDDTDDDDDDDDDTAALEYIVRQLERISASPDWSTCVVRWSHLMRYDADVALAIESDYPRFAPYVDEALQRVLTQYYADDYVSRGSRSACCLVFSRVPRCYTIRALRASAVGQLCAIRGVVTRTSQVRPELLVGVFRCADCGTESAPVAQPFHYTEPPACRNTQCENKTHFQLIPSHAQTRFGDWQKLRIQEDTNHIPAGCMPRTIEVIVRGDAVEVVKPGDRVMAVGCVIVVPEVLQLLKQVNRREVQRQMTGAQRAQRDAQADMEGATGLRALGVRELGYRMCFLATTLTDAHGDDRKMTEAIKDTAAAAAAAALGEGYTPSIFATDGSGNSTHNGDDDVAAVAVAATATSSTTTPAEAAAGGAASRTPWLGVGGGAPPSLTPAEYAKVRHMRQHDNLLRALTSCIAPNVFKHDVVKLGLLLQMVGGVSKATADRIALRGDINVCIVGDPSTAKSQFLKWVAQTAPRGVYTSGKASTASGLTATVTRDADTGERTIEAGALMLADRGICCIDEFDKMELKDQVAIHEAMEQQTISIAKAGIKATLNAKTALLAAMNPIGGKYDRRKPLQKNIAMSAPILSRFDLLFVLVDDAGDEADYAMADALLRLHRFGAAAVRQAFTLHEFLLYLRYARTLQPRLTPPASQLIVEAYRDMRVQDALSNRSRVYRVTTRLLESMIRLSEATAKLHLCDDVLPSHVHVALELMRQSLCTLDMTEVELVDTGNDDDGGSGNGANGNKRGGATRTRMTATTTTTTAQRPDEAPSHTRDVVDGDGNNSGEEQDGNNSVASSSSSSAATESTRTRRRKRARGEAPAATAAAAATAVSQQQQPQQAASRRVVISADHYFSIVNRLVMRLQSLGEAAAPTRQELVTWYLEQVQSLHRAQLEAELRYVSLVLARMLREGKLLEVAVRDDDEARIYLDPNYNPDVSQR